MKGRWKDYFEELMKEEDEASVVTCMGYGGWKEKDAHAIMKLKIGKAPRVDRIMAETLKYGGECDRLYPFEFSMDTDYARGFGESSYCSFIQRKTC